MNANQLFGNQMPRREFLLRLGTIAGATAFSGCPVADINVSAGKNSAGIPLRVLGRTGAKITVVGLGTGPVGHSKPGADKGVPILRAALEAGINYVDTAHIYDDAETYLGEVVPKFRDKIFLTTKARPDSNDPAEAARQMQTQFEQSLRLLKTDHVDLLHIHSIGDKTPEMLLAPGGPMDFVRKVKEKGLTRFIGISGHNGVARFPALINTGEVDVAMLVLNFADFYTYQFEELVLPVARKHNCGILAMKVFGGHAGGFGGYRQRGPCKMPAQHLESALRYSLTIPGVAGGVIGVYGEEEIRQNIEWAKNLHPLSADETAALREHGKKLAQEWGPRFGPA